jgi:hypothetical protein
MSKISYSTKNGQLSILHNRCIELVFNDQKIVFDLCEFAKFVKYFNTYVNFNKKALLKKDQMYSKLLEDLDTTQVNELRKLVSMPVCVSHSNIFNHLYYTKRQELISSSNDNRIKVNFDFIGLN